MNRNYDVIIVGTGVAGLFAALHLPRTKKVLVICKDKPDISDSYLAQGGICRLQGESDFESFYDDTMRAGHGENNPASVERMIRQSEEVTDELISYGVDFARNKDGSLAVTREGGHSRNRILYHEDCTGKEITACLLERVKELKNVEIAEQTVMLDIIADKECLGIVALDKKSKKTESVFADYTVLACGGIGGIFEKSTNFPILTGDGVAIALKHGVAVDSINYIQIHPTTLYSEKGGRSFLISESVRGEGAHLLDKNFKRFCDELQPRDKVTAEIRKQMQKDGTKHVWLDMRPIPKDEIKTHFPAIVKRCAEEGYDVFKECIPVVPAQHYFMGGIRSDTDGKTTMPRLYAVGETCCNGVHGANRLASNSLLESLVFAKRAALNISEEYTAANRTVKVNLQGFADTDKIFTEYKLMLQNAIKEADDERLKRN
ncbi:MAG: L-aspartate oxidase [Clostridia bacterium]|nr:L-aspartate oxidase [Clostridia bacterium]